MTSQASEQDMEFLTRQIVRGFLGIHRKLDNITVVLAKLVEVLTKK